MRGLFLPVQTALIPEEAGGGLTSQASPTGSLNVYPKRDGESCTDLTVSFKNAFVGLAPSCQAFFGTFTGTVSIDVVFPAPSPTSTTVTFSVDPAHVFAPFSPLPPPLSKFFKDDMGISLAPPIATPPDTQSSLSSQASPADPQPTQSVSLPGTVIQTVTNTPAPESVPGISSTSTSTPSIESTSESSSTAVPATSSTSPGASTSTELTDTRAGELSSQIPSSSPSNVFGAPESKNLHPSQANSTLQTLYSTSAVPSSAESQSEAHSHRRSGQIAGGIIGGLIALALLCFAGFLLYRKIQRARKLPSAEFVMYAANHGPLQGTADFGMPVSQRTSLEKVEPPPPFSQGDFDDPLFEKIKETRQAYFDYHNSTREPVSELSKY